MKTLKEILQLEVYEPKSPDEKRFKDKHVVVKHKDANGNDDDLFNAKNIKTVDRTPEHGYNPGEDEKVYESNAEYEESGRGRYKVNYVHPDKKNIGNDRFETKEQARRFAKSLERKGYHKITIGEEVEELDEREMKAGNVYAIATARVKEKHGLTGNNVDLTKAQTIEAHQLAKKIAKRMGISLKEAAKAATKQSTHDRMLDLLVKSKAIPNKETPIPSPKYPEKMTGPEEAGPDGRYGGLPQDPSKGVFKVGGKIVIGTLDPNYTKPPKSPRKPRSKK